MMPPSVSPPESPQPGARGTLIDRRPTPRGGLPRHLQTWLMVAIAMAMLLIIYLTGRPVAPSSTRAGETSTPAPTALPPERVRTYQQRLAEQEARLRQELAVAALDQQHPVPVPPVDVSSTADAIAEERRRRDYQSLFADNVALSYRSASQPPSAPPSSRQDPASVGATPSTTTQAEPAAADAPASPARDAAPADAPIGATGPLHRLLEGTVMETVLLNRLDGTFAGSLTCLVTTPVYSHSRQHVVIPAGARVLGSASPLQAWGESRLAVRFHRLIMPDGRTHSLEKFTGLNQAGDTGLRDQVNRHYLQVFGASLAIGALSGLAQFQTRGGADADSQFSDAYRQGLGGSLAASAGRVLDRFLNVLPTVTIREGHRVKVYFTSDLELPEYRP